MTMPDWWLTASGLFFILGCIAFLAIILVAVLAGMMVLDIRRRITSVLDGANGIVEKAKSIADTVSDTTTDVAARAKGLARIVDDQAGAAFDTMDKYAPALLGFSVLAKIWNLAKDKKNWWGR